MITFERSKLEACIIMETVATTGTTTCHAGQESVLFWDGAGQ
jgi:hypothetical protein